jgi:hypothetical protein
MIRGSVVDVATGYGLDDRGVGFRVPVGSRIFTSPLRSDRSGALSRGVKLQDREPEHLPPSSAEVNKILIYTSTPPYAFMA